MKIKCFQDEFNFNSDLINEIASSCGITFDTARLLFYRNIDSVEKAKRYLNPSKSYFINPFLLNGMQQAVEIINNTVKNKGNIVIFGDYDADGICATSVLYYAFKTLDVNVKTLIPEREEGYGLNLNKIFELHNQNIIDLLITVDCGISDKEKIDYLMQNGINVIVTDHHEPPEILPNCISVNPKISGQKYGFDGLCGAGVAYKLAYALIGEKANALLDFVALATVADSMDLVGENRDIVVEGLKIFNSNKLRPCFKYLLNNNNKKITAQMLAFAVAPRVNAGGRMGNANLSLELFLCDDENKIFDYAVELNNYNSLRQLECDKVFNQAVSIINEQKLYNDNIILVGDKSWKIGIIGIVSAKLVEIYNKPVITFAYFEGNFKGSARSVDGVNIHTLLSNCKDLLVGFGGHAQAAGVTVSEANLKPLRDKINSLLDNTCSPDFTRVIWVDWRLTETLSNQFVKEIDLLEPFGVGNKKPLFSDTMQNCFVRPLKAGSPHYTFNTDNIEMLDFNGENDVSVLSLPISKEIVFEANLSSFNGVESIKGYVKEILPDFSNYVKLTPYIFENELDKILYCDDYELPFWCGEIKKTGTIFTLSDSTNLSNYAKINSLPVYLYTPQGKSNESCVVLSLKYAPPYYSEVVYLDKPLSVIPFEQNFILNNVSGYDFINKLSVERDVFATYFNKISALCGSQFYSACNLFYTNCNDGDPLQFVFCLKTFMELGFFVVKNNTLYKDNGVKSPLTGSKIYSKICSKRK